MIINKTKNKVIAKEIILCNTAWSSMRGLMFRKKLEKQQCLLIDLHKDCNAAIHMVFVNFPIDVIWLNSKKKVVDFSINLKPYTLYKSPKKFARYILELPSGTISKMNLSIGDSFCFNLVE